MSDIAIKVENLSKLYQLGSIGTGTLGNDLKRWWASTRGKEDPFAKIGQVNDRTRKAMSDYVWALKDIEFEVKKGEVLGIIGRNGAGKSTLLKILSKITNPSTGKINVDGRIASLLEVGTGFHPELSGRENIFMNGAILGLRKWEIQKKFDEIVDFSGVEAYIDTPVKRYSSGMYVRLAFAVAAFLEPEILIVDEVLAVGDAEFQKKCLGRMKDVSVNNGRTVLFVSHNIEAVKALCNKGLFLINGTVTKKGNIGEVCTHYLLQDTTVENTEYIFKNDMSKEIVIEYAGIFVNGLKSNRYTNLDEIEVHLTVHANKSIEYSIELLLKDQNQSPVLFSPVGLITGYTQKLKRGQKKVIRMKICLPFLASGRYYFDLMLVESGKQFYHYANNALFFDIEANYIKKTGWNFTQQGGQGTILLESIKIIED